MTLAPLYDIASILPYEADPRFTQPELAQKVGGERRVFCIQPSHWAKEAKRWGLKPEAAWPRVRDLAERCRSQVDAVFLEAREEGIDAEATYVAVRTHLDAVLALS